MITVTIARKPIEGSVAANSIKWGTGGINIDASRIGSEEIQTNRYTPGKDMTSFHGSQAGNDYVTSHHNGRWPANLVMSHIQGCVESGVRQAPGKQLAAGFVGFGPGRDDKYLKGTGSKHAPDTQEIVWTCQEGCPVAGLNIHEASRYFKVLK